MSKSRRFDSEDFEPEDFSGFIRGRSADHRIHQHVDEIQRQLAYQDQQMILAIQWEEENPLPELDEEGLPELREKLRKILSE